MSLCCIESEINKHHLAVTFDFLRASVLTIYMPTEKYFMMADRLRPIHNDSPCTTTLILRVGACDCQVT